MAAYRTAARLFPGLHLPLAGMGMEYARMNNAALAEQLLLAAHRTCPLDPLACHELGCLAFRGRQLTAAERWFMMALKRVPGRMTAGRSQLPVWIQMLCAPVLHIHNLHACPACAVPPRLWRA